MAATIELVGVLAVGTAEQLDASAWPDETVWSGYGAGYGWAPLALPVVALGRPRAQPKRRRATGGPAGLDQSPASASCFRHIPHAEPARLRQWA